MTGRREDPTGELEFHLEMLTRRYIEEGLDADAARVKALARMGDLRAAARESAAILRQTESTMNRASLFEDISQDIRHAFRVLKRSPGYVVIAVLMLALGTGASTAVFSVVDGVILRSAFADADAVAFLHIRTSSGQRSSAIPTELYERLTAGLPAPIAAAGTVTTSSPIVTRVDVSRRGQVECVSASMANVLGTQPQMGRWFTAAEDRPGAHGVAVVSARFWRSTLNGDPGVLGRTVALDDEPVTIVGVMPAGFDGPLSRVNRDMWVPVGQVTQARPLYGCRVDDNVNAVVRMQPGVTTEAGAGALNAAAGTDALLLTPILEGTIGDLRGPFNALAGAVIAVLLIAVANVTNLGLERLAGRQQELAIRVALGATRARLIRETVWEHSVVAGLGATAGVAIAAISFEAILGLLPPSLPNLDAISMNGRVLAASIGLALLGGLCSGMLSAVQASSPAVRAGMAAGDRGHTRAGSRVRRVLVVSELALGVLLLVGALLMIRTFLTLRPSAPGFDPSNKHVALVRLPPAMVHGDRVRFFESVRGELAATPGVQAVAGTTHLPMYRSISVLNMSAGGTKGEVFTATDTADYFDVMRIPVTRGRGFTELDGPGTPPVAVVNEAFVRRWLPSQEPLGSTVTLDGRGAPPSPVTIVGVIGDARSFGSDTRTRPEIHLPFSQAMIGSPFFVVHADARTSATLASTMRDIVSRVRPGQLVDRVDALDRMLLGEVARPRLGAWLFGMFAALAVLLAAVGLAATLAWSVAQRRREIGIRMALGARPGDVRGLVVRQTLAMSVAGVVVGLLGAAATTRLLEGWLYGVTPLDATTFAACGTAMLVVAAIAAYIPTRRATRIDPLIALRGNS